MNEEKLVQRIRVLGNISPKVYKEYLDTLEVDEVEDLYYTYSSKIEAKEGANAQIFPMIFVALSITLFSFIGLFMKELYITLLPQNPEQANLLLTNVVCFIFLIVTSIALGFRWINSRQVNLIKKKKILEAYLFYLASQEKH